MEHKLKVISIQATTMKGIMGLHFTHWTGLGKRGSEESRIEQEVCENQVFSTHRRPWLGAASP